MKRWKVYRRVLLTSGDLSKDAHLFLTKRGLTQVPGETGAYNWNSVVEAEDGAEAELIMQQRLENLLLPYEIRWTTTKTTMSPED